MMTVVFAAGGGTVAVSSAMLSLARARSAATPSSCCISKADAAGTNSLASLSRLFWQSSINLISALETPCASRRALSSAVNARALVISTSMRLGWRNGTSWRTP